jgi:hypothetical protein
MTTALYIENVDLPLLNRQRILLSELLGIISCTNISQDHQDALEGVVGMLETWRDANLDVPIADSLEG